MSKRAFSDLQNGQMATIIQSGLCRTRCRHRPAPSLFYFPGLSSRPVWSEPAPFSLITQRLQDNFGHILNEYNSMRHFMHDKDVHPRVNNSTNTPTDKVSIKSDYDANNNERKLHHGGWDWNSYLLKGVRQQSFAVSCPKTTETLESFTECPQLMTGTPFSYAFFSTLTSKSSIQPHNAPCNLRIRCHFPLIIPNDCGMRIAGNEYKWKVGEPMFFDDSYEHEGSFHLPYH